MTTDEAQTVNDEETRSEDPAAHAEPVPPPPTVSPMAPPAASTQRLPDKVPMTAALLSVAPGLGNIYNGLYGRGVAFFLIQFGLLRTAVSVERDEDLAILIPSIFFFWLFNMFDAYRQATLLNLGGQRASIPTARRAEAGGFLLPGLVLIGLGAIGVADRYFDLDVWQMFDHWPVLMLAGGGILVFRAVTARSGS